MTTTPDKPDLELTDIGPATPPPSWCLPDARPNWERMVLSDWPDDMAAECDWQRKISDEVWIQAEDRIIDGRVLRTEPRIHYFEPAHVGVSPLQARAVAEALIAAADIITLAALQEATQNADGSQS